MDKQNIFTSHIYSDLHSSVKSSVHLLETNVGKENTSRQNIKKSLVEINTLQMNTLKHKQYNSLLVKAIQVQQRCPVSQH